jgi:hypothetical protein
MKMAMKVHAEDGTSEVLVISKLVEIKTTKNVMEIEKLKDNTLRIIYSSGLFPNFDKVVGLELVRM